MHLWVWIALGALTVLVIVEQLRIFKANREFRKKDEIFQAVTENAADMIALVDVKGRRLYNSPAYQRVLGRRAQVGLQLQPSDSARVHGRRAKAMGGSGCEVFERQFRIHYQPVLQASNCASGKSTTDPDHP